MEASAKIEKGASKTILMLILLLILVGGIYYAYTQSASLRRGVPFCQGIHARCDDNLQGAHCPASCQSAYRLSTSKWKQSKRK